jgi:hypothetical protein
MRVTLLAEAECSRCRADNWFRVARRNRWEDAWGR